MDLFLSYYASHLQDQTDEMPFTRTGYLNLRILLFGSILLTSTPAERSSVPGSYECVQKCLDSAKRTIEIIHETYHHQEFFRTWPVTAPPPLVKVKCLSN